VAGRWHDDKVAGRWHARRGELRVHEVDELLGGQLRQLRAEELQAPGQGVRGWGLA
jgi:hypothetical protein